MKEPMQWSINPKKTDFDVSFRYLQFYHAEIDPDASHSHSTYLYAHFHIVHSHLLSLYHARTKHIELQHHFIREKIESKEIELIYCNTSENVADIFTKPVGKIHFEILRQKLGVVENPFLH